LRSIGPTAKLIGEQGVGPTVAARVSVLGIEDRERADKSKSVVVKVDALTIEVLEHKNVTAADVLKPSLARTQSAAPCEIQRRKLDPLQIKSIGSFGEFCEPEPLVVFDGRLRTCATHAGSWLELLKQLLGNRPAIFDGFRCRNEIGKLMRSVVRGSWSWRLDFEPEAEITGAVLRAVNEVIDLFQICWITLEFMLNNPPSPRWESMLQVASPSRPGNPDGKFDGDTDRPTAIQQ
jgi:hypothetical protein